MRKELNEQEMNEVVGGCVYFSNVYNAVAFSTIGERYDLTIGWKEARDLAENLCINNHSMGEREFDIYIRDLFQSNGWLAPYTKTVHN